VTDIISTDHPMSPGERAVLSALLDTLLPASEDGTMPSAADVDFDAYLLEQAEDFVADLTSIVQSFDPEFAELPLAERCERLGEFSGEAPDAFRNLLTRVYDCYYQNDLVRERIGVVKGAVFPQGNEIAAGDLALLDPVIANSDLYRYRKT